MRGDNNVYYKRGRKYYPLGIQVNYIPDGIWLVRHTDYSSSTTNVDHYLSNLYKLGDVPDFIDIPKICSIEKYAEHFLNSKEFKRIQDGGHFTWKELVAHLITAILEVNKQIKNKENGTR